MSNVDDLRIFSGLSRSDGAVAYLRHLVGSLESLYGYSNVMKPIADRAMDDVMSLIEVWAPHGLPEPGYGVTPSQRIGHTPIAYGWDSKVEEIEGGHRLTITNASEHIRYVIGGTDPHLIVKGGLTAGNLIFFWGEYGNRPWKNVTWGPKKSHEGPPGMRRFKWVDHPGIEQGNDFVARAARNQKDSVAKSTKEGTAGYVRRLMSNFGLKER